LSNDKDFLREIGHKYDLDFHNEGANEEVFEVSTKKTVGISEVQTLQNLYNAVVQLINKEKLLRPVEVI
jgi:protein-arginine kinase